jgi:hypothetical protein
MEQANNLINGLAGENARWTEDSNNFADAAPSTASSAIAWSLNVGLKGLEQQRECQSQNNTVSSRQYRGILAKVLPTERRYEQTARSSPSFKSDWHTLRGTQY